jgi:hypothetical protein
MSKKLSGVIRVEAPGIRRIQDIQKRKEYLESLKIIKSKKKKEKNAGKTLRKITKDQLEK